MNTNLLEIDLALLDAVKRGDIEMAEALLACGADPNATDLVDGQPALAHAARQGADLADLLLRHGARPLETSSDFPDPPARPAPARGRRKGRGEKAAPAQPDWLPQLRQLYQSAGYIRRPAGENAGKEEFDHLWEVRFLVSGKRNLARLCDLLGHAGLPCGEAKRLCGFMTQVVPGREAVQRLLGLLGRG